jgi:hypothetical protein
MSWDGTSTPVSNRGDRAFVRWENAKELRILKESKSLTGRILACGGLALVGLILAVTVSCDYSAPEALRGPGDGVGPGPRTKPAPFEPTLPGRRAEEARAAILENSITLIQRAALQPGGENFRLAIQKLNQYFDGTSPSEYELEPAAREYLLTQLPPAALREIERREWVLRDLRHGDTRHVEDCMMYHGIAFRVAGTGDDLSRVRRVFDWAMRQVQLVPPGSLGSGRLAQAIARPYDILMRGMGTETDGYWAERSWLFMVLCRQLGIDTGLVTYSKSNTLERLIPSVGTNMELDATLMNLLNLRRAPKSPIIWVCAALVDNKAYLFDARLGLEIPGPDGAGVATLEDALTDPAVLERMNSPGLAPYGTSRSSLLASPSKIGILIDSSLGYFAPKMKMLQRELAGENRAILYRNPADERDHFVAVLGDRIGSVSLWALPMEVETQLFNNAQFVDSIQASLFLFQREFPLVYARVKQLRGEFEDAVQDYVKLRIAENAPLVTDKKRTIPKEVQDGLYVYATYYLALTHLDQNNLGLAELMFQKTLEILPEPGPKQPYYDMFRWGAHTNLARIYEARKDIRRAIAHYVQHDPTSQYIGNQLRARELVWRDPMAAPADPLPPAPQPKPALRSSAAAVPGPRSR